MKKRGLFLGIFILLLVGCFCLAVFLGWAALPPRATFPVVKILMPPDGLQVALNSTVPVLVQAQVENDRLRRVQLYADSQLIGNVPTRADTLQTLWKWNALTPGDHTLAAQAVSSHGATASTSIRLRVVEAADTDGDGLPDDVDRCPEQSGLFESEGCPTESANDSDGDTVPDDQDRCADEYGLSEHEGCPLPSDRDGDGLPDEEDSCPDAPGPAESGGCASLTGDDGDGDGISDSVDFCPEEGGTLDSSGCPPAIAGDRDGDGVSDDEDSCPDTAGDLEHDGCPYVTDADRDGDGVPDDTDGCPDDPGSETLGGCPFHLPPGMEHGLLPSFCIRFPALCESLIPDTDTDGDGVTDTEDRCPEEYGPPSADGCPILGAWRREAAGSRALLCAIVPAACGIDEGRAVSITIDLAENLYTDQDWLAVWCYFSGTDGVWYRLPLEDPSLRRREPQIWYLGDHRSVTIATHERSLLSVRAFCEALAVPFGEPQSLGQIVRIHGPSDWNGIPYMLWSEGASSRFMIIYTMRCSGCD